VSKRNPAPEPAPQPLIVRPGSALAAAEGKPNVVRRPLNKSEVLSIGLIMLAAFILRLLFLPAVGHATDIGTFEAWTNSIGTYGPSGFYGHAGFVDYPPGYMLVLWGVAGLHGLLAGLAGAHFDLLLYLVKLPAILADIGICYLTFLIARRMWNTSASLFVAGIVAFNPAIWFVSSVWGQADSVAAVFLVWAIYLALTDRFEFAWAALAFAVLIKPHPIAVAPLLALWQIRRQGLHWRLALIPVIGLAVAYLGSVAFAPNALPNDTIAWLWNQYGHGRDVYPFNSVNAFNLYSIAHDFWEPDSNPTLLGTVPWLSWIPTFFGAKGGPQWLWGLIIFGGLMLAVMFRQWRATSPATTEEDRERTLLFACFLAMLGYFMVLTRMHERYLFSAIALAPLVWNFGTVTRIATVVLSATFLINLRYALEYLKTPSQDLNPLLVHPLSLLNILVLFVLAATYLVEEFGAGLNQWLARGVRFVGRTAPQLVEGLVSLSRVDRWIVLGLTAGNCLWLFFGLSNPNKRIFDEIYYARSAQEYLQHKDVFEWTHPPLPKLAMAATAWFFQIFLPAFGAWLAHHGIAFGAFFVKNQVGDPVSSRVAVVIAGTLFVPLLYAFAKRLFASTPAALISVFLLLTSGFFYVHSRVALPEIYVALFSLAALYCGYRFWTSVQIVRRTDPNPYTPSVYFTTAAVALGIAAFVALEVNFFEYQYGSPAGPAVTFVIFAAFMLALGAACTWWALRERGQRESGKTIVYPDGTWSDGKNVSFPSGEKRSLKATINDADQRVTWSSDGAEAEEGDEKVNWWVEGSISGSRASEPIADQQRWGVWLVLTGLALGCAGASKWYGGFDLVVIWAVAAFVVAQQFGVLDSAAALLSSRRAQKPGVKPDVGPAPRRFAWGNPLGWRLPLFLGATILIAFAVYVLTYIPYFTLGKNFQDMLILQHSMYVYHHDTVATATHPYASKWWTWPFDLRPVSYYYDTFTGPKDPVQIVAEILALPNPFVWVAGVLTVPLAGFLAWRARAKGMLMLVFAYFVHWLPWMFSPRIDFQYNVFNNLAIVCLCTTYVLQRFWLWATAAPEDERGRRLASMLTIGGYLAACLLTFIFFYPLLSGQHIPQVQWQARMWLNGGAPGWWGWI
jgi:Gpi18-like mannosyltransferase